MISDNEIYCQMQDEYLKDKSNNANSKKLYEFLKELSKKFLATYFQKKALPLADADTKAHDMAVWVMTRYLTDKNFKVKKISAYLYFAMLKTLFNKSDIASDKCVEIDSNAECKMIKKLCGWAGCSNLTDGAYYCDEHKVKADKMRVKPFERADRHNGKLYKTPEWRKLRRMVIADSKQCARCGSYGYLTVHHRVPPRGKPELFYAEENLEVLCVSCHRIETQREIEERKNRRKK